MDKPADHHRQAIRLALPELPGNLWELLAWIQVYRNSIVIKMDDGLGDMALGQLPADVAAWHIRLFVDAWLENRAVPVRVKSDRESTEDISHVAWVAIGMSGEG